MANPLPFLRINTPSAFKSSDEKVESITIELNRIFEQLTRWIKDNSEQSTQVRVLNTDLDLGNHQIVNLADPRALTDGANRRYVDERTDELREQIEDIEDEDHNGDGDEAVGRRFLLQRVVPTTIDDTIEIGSWELSGSGHAFDIAITVSEAGFSVAKAYAIVSQYGINNAWQIALPLVDTGVYLGQNFDLDIKQDDASSTLALRLRRTLGATTGTATIQITARGKQSDLFRESSAAALVTAPVLFFPTAILTVQAGDVGVNTSTPNLLALGVAASVSGDAGLDSRAGLELVNPVPGTTSTIGQLRYYGGTALLVSLTGRCDGAVDSGALSFFTKKTGVAISVGLALTSVNNLVLGGGITASGENVFLLKNGVAPSANVTDSVQVYAADQVAGNSTVHVRTEAGQIVKLFTGSSLTAPDGTLANVVLRVAQLEARLQAAGIIA